MVAAGCDVLIAGAGPTGLMLALWLTHAGARVRIVDKAAEPGTTSRALAVHARTLELYRQIGLADAVIERGLKFTAVNLTIRSESVGHVRLDETGASMTPYPFVVIFPQDLHERLLIERLDALGVRVERSTTLVGFDDDGTRVRAELARDDGTRKICEVPWLAGCDGAHSKVRERIAAQFPGGTYSRIFYVADVQASGPMIDGQLHVAIDLSDFLAIFPLKGKGRARVIGTVEELSEEARARYTWQDVSKGVFERFSIGVDRVNWFSTYRVHHRVASRFRGGRAFLLGDAAHIHSPVGGQGMNTGLGDAANLAWKLAAVVSGEAGDAILDTYEPERSAFARRLVNTTDRVFTLITSEGALPRFMRLHVVPRIVRIVSSRAAFRRFLFRTVSQTAIDYRGGGLDAGRAGTIAGGDRLPWVRIGGGIDNFEPLSSLGWQLHVYGEPASTLRAACDKRCLPLHAFAWQPSMEDAGFVRNAAYLVRPDGYIGFVDAGGDASALATYIDRWRLRFDVRAPERAHA